MCLQTQRECGYRPAFSSLHIYPMMKKYIFYVLILLLTFYSYSEQLSGIIVDENHNPLPYSTLRIKTKGIASLADSTGKFNLTVGKYDKTDTLNISYLGYRSLNKAIGEIIGQRSLVLEKAPATTLLEELVVPPEKTKIKTRKVGKKHSWAMMKSVIDGDVAGECFGYEFHAKPDKKYLLHKVGFYYCEGPSQMTKMKFRINVYDMSEVKKAPSSNFINILPKPIYFDYVLTENLSGKFEYEIPFHIALPKDALVEIEFLENLKDEYFWFRSNMFGKNTWNRTLVDGIWDKNPFATPFFIECMEVDK